MISVRKIGKLGGPVMDGGRLKRLRQDDLQTKCFLIQRVYLFYFIQSMLFERGFNPVQNVEHMMLFRPEIA